FTLLTREAGKTALDAVAELREAVDFLRYYADENTRLAPASAPRGRFLCISPWNFPLAIFTGQIAAALAAGNAVLAKPAEQTCLVADLAVQLLHTAGVPRAALQLLPGTGADVGATLTAAAAVDGVCFTGSTATAKRIARSLASEGNPAAPLIAETGGINAMIVDSTALPEQAVRDIIASAFQSAGQRCSALRVLFVQEDVADTVEEMILGAMDELSIGDPSARNTDVGPIIDAAAQTRIAAAIDAARAEGRVLKALDAPSDGTFIGPAALRVAGMADVKEEIFGPVLHIARYAARDLDQVIESINASGYGLTFGLHTRIDGRVAHVTDRVEAGNLYVNRNQIGAIVGSQPFGGEGLSGTGPKAGGPNYLPAFRTIPHTTHSTNREPVAGRIPEQAPAQGSSTAVSLAPVQSALDALTKTQLAPMTRTEMPGPTGEANMLSVGPRGTILCLGPDAASAAAQAATARAAGCRVLVIAPVMLPGPSESDPGQRVFSGTLDPALLKDLTGLCAVVHWGTAAEHRAIRLALADRPGPLLPLITDADLATRTRLERHVSIDTTAAGGN
ncbi:MAG: L-glutamate gamma-semialdehyde dehydrogenase, partial [Pseudomonadota bacterium]